jgi:hypothetical protein
MGEQVRTAEPDLGVKDAGEVIGWRREELKRAGYDEQQAQALAENLYVDLHSAVGLLGRGCPAELAVQILL